MASKVIPNHGESPRRPPATNSASRESQLSSLAFDLAEKQLREGTATAQVITHYLKAGSDREKLEREKIRLENELSRAKAEALTKQDDMARIASEAILAMRSYQGAPPEELEEDFLR